MIPDVIPVLGLLDDLMLVPLGVALTVRLVPAAVMADARADRPVSRAAAVAVVAVWLALAVGIALAF